MANDLKWLVVFTNDDREVDFEDFADLAGALDFIRQRAAQGKRENQLFEEVPFTVTVDVEVGGTPRRKRKDSPAPEQPTQNTPAAADDAPKAGDVRPAVAAGTVAPEPPRAVTPSRALLSCGGKACETRDGKELHRMDASCSKFNGTRKGAAAR